MNRTKPSRNLSTLICFTGLVKCPNFIVRTLGFNNVLRVTFSLVRIFCRSDYEISRKVRDVLTMKEE